MVISELWGAYLIAVLAVMIVPGPSHLLMVSNSLAFGSFRAMATAAGDLSANTIQIILAGLSFSFIVVSYPLSFEILRWLGISYLLYLGFSKVIFSKSLRIKPAQSNHGNLWFQGFFTSLTNPKAVLFFAALFPQFISPDYDLFPQLFLLGVSYIMIDGIFLGFYGFLGGRIQTNEFLKAKLPVISGLGLISVAVFLMVK